MTRARQTMEMMMRITPPTLALSSLLLLVTSVGHSRPAAVPSNPAVVALIQAGDAALTRADGTNVAIDDYETALALDPQNREVLVGLAKAALAQGLPGKAIHYYRVALTAHPDDVALLEGQGEALVAKGAFAKANENLAKIRALCLTSCAEQVTLSDVIAHDTAQPAISAAQIKINPILSETGARN